LKWVVGGTTTALTVASGAVAVVGTVIAVVGAVVTVADLLSEPEATVSGFEPIPVAVPVAASPKRTPPRERKNKGKNNVSFDGDNSDGNATDGYATDFTTGGYSTSGYNTVASDEEDAKKRSIVLRNGSSRTVSFFVLHEANMRTKAIKTKIKKEIASYFKCSIAGAGAALSGKGSTETITVKENDPAFLLHDHRIRPSRSPGCEDHVEIGTTIKYPRRCRNLRVLAYFRDDKGEWKRYKNKVYRVGRRKTSHTITAMDHQMEGHW